MFPENRNTLQPWTTCDTLPRHICLWPMTRLFLPGMDIDHSFLQQSIPQFPLRGASYQPPLAKTFLLSPPLNTHLRPLSSPFFPVDPNNAFTGYGGRCRGPPPIKGVLSSAWAAAPWEPPNNFSTQLGPGLEAKVRGHRPELKVKTGATDQDKMRKLEPQTRGKTRNPYWWTSWRWKAFNAKYLEASQ